MRILITGAFGQLGQSLTKVLGNTHDMILTGPNIPNGKSGIHLNIQNKMQMKEVFDATYPDLIINLAAMTNVDKCELYPDLAKEINIAGLQNICDVFDGKIIQLSTDYVFDGQKGPYKEDDSVNPISVYGETKLAAEKILLNHDPNSLIIRGNVLYDYSNQTNASFLNWVVNSLRAGQEIKVVDDQFNNPTWTMSIAKIINLCIMEKLEGIFHWGDADYINRYEFAKIIIDKFSLKSSLIKPIKTEELNQLAERPKQSGLISDRIMKILNIKPPSIDYCLNEIINIETI
tara:strand:+ start:928 stop:1794 length:867 start_codon:yes stop_codon:yes gene_type:complete